MKRESMSYNAAEVINCLLPQKYWNENLDLSNSMFTRGPRCYYSPEALEFIRVNIGEDLWIWAQTVLSVHGGVGGPGPDPVDQTWRQVLVDYVVNP